MFSYEDFSKLDLMQITTPLKVFFKYWNSFGDCVFSANADLDGAWIFQSSANGLPKEMSLTRRHPCREERTAFPAVGFAQKMP